MTLERVDSPLAGRRPGPLGPVGGVSTLGGQVPSGTGIAPPHAERSAAPFWLELKGVERWFDTLDPSERLTLIASLFGRSTEPQLRQFAAAIDKSLQTAQYATTAPAAPGQPPFASNLSRFGVGQGASHSPDYAALRYRAPLQKQPSGSGNPGSSGGASGPATGAPASAGGAASVSAGVGSVNSAPSASGYIPPPLSQPLNAPLASTQNPFSPSSDLYSQAFLPLPRSKSYTPWGPEIRPKSATADAWPDLPSGRASPQPAQSSPNLAALSLESISASTSPIGHPVKPWRTFTPVALGQAPEPFDLGRPARPTPSQAATTPQSVTQAGPQSSGSSGASTGPSNGLASGAQPGQTSGIFGNSNSSSSTHAPPMMPPHPLDLNKVAAQGGMLAASPIAAPRPASATVHPAAEPTSGSVGSVGSSGSSAATADLGSPTPSLYALAGKQSPKRNVNVVDVELLGDIGAWLRSLRLHKYTGNLSGMRWQDVVQLEDADLEARGVNALGARRKLLKMFEEIRQAQEAGLLSEERA